MLDDAQKMFDNKRYDEALELLGNYSFNDFPTYDIEWKYYFHKYWLLTVLDKDEEALDLVNEYIDQVEINYWENESLGFDEDISGFYIMRVISLNNLGYTLYALECITRDWTWDKWGDEEKEFYNYANESVKTQLLEFDYEDRKLFLYNRNINGIYLGEEVYLMGKEGIPNGVTFPVAHPVNNGLYIGHPFNPNYYMPVETYDYELLNDRINELCYLLQCLGATHISIVNTKSNKNIYNQNNQNNSSSRDSLNGGVSFGPVSVSGGQSKGDSSQRKQSTNNEIESYMKVSREQQFNPTNAPFVPEGLIWYPNEIGWQRLVQQRLNGGILSHT